MNPPTCRDPKLFGGWPQSLAAKLDQGFKVWRKLKMVRKPKSGHQDGARIQGNSKPLQWSTWRETTDVSSDRILQSLDQVRFGKYD